MFIHDSKLLKNIAILSVRVLGRLATLEDLSFKINEYVLRLQSYMKLTRFVFFLQQGNLTKYLDILYACYFLFHYVMGEKDLSSLRRLRNVKYIIEII